jgi:hypothetical protein
LRDPQGVANIATLTMPFINRLAMRYALFVNLHPALEGSYGKLSYVLSAGVAAVPLLFVFRSHARIPVQGESQALLRSSPSAPLLFIELFRRMDFQIPLARDASLTKKEHK